MIMWMLFMVLLSCVPVSSQTCTDETSCNACEAAPACVDRLIGGNHLYLVNSRRYCRDVTRQEYVNASATELSSPRTFIKTSNKTNPLERRSGLWITPRQGLVKSRLGGRKEVLFNVTSRATLLKLRVGFRGPNPNAINFTVVPASPRSCQRRFSVMQARIGGIGNIKKVRCKRDVRRSSEETTQLKLVIDTLSCDDCSFTRLKVNGRDATALMQRAWMQVTVYTPCSDEQIDQWEYFTSGGRCDNDRCHAAATDLQCSGRGSCECGNCYCEQGFTGRFCECDNLCPVDDQNRQCAGPTQGECVCGECHCLPGFSGSACEVSLSNERCRLNSDISICSNHGDCVDGMCVCHRHYTGRYCRDSVYG